MTASAFLSSGCSALIARSGADLSTLTTRESVHQEFGEPSISGTAEGQPFEDFRTRRKISEPLRAYTNCMGIAMTFGVGELFGFPHELYLLVRRTVFSQDVRFSYDSAGNVTSVSLDGEWLGFLPKAVSRAQSQ